METITLSTGVAVLIRKISPFSLDAVRRRYPAPAPPMVQVDYGDGKKVNEANESDPDYLAALRDHQALLSDKITYAMFQLGLDVTVDQASLDVFKADMAALDIPLDGDDKQIYIRHVAIGTKEDMEMIIRAITRTTIPTEEAVQDHLVTFSGDVSRAESDGHPAAALRGSL